MGLSVFHPRPGRCLVLMQLYGWQEGSVQQTLVPPAILSLLVYTIGIPMTFLAILVIHGPAIKLDQTMRAANQGGTEASNPEYYIRKRYQELYR
jgi:hypothetical protein